MLSFINTYQSKLIIKRVHMDRLKIVFYHDKLVGQYSGMCNPVTCLNDGYVFFFGGVEQFVPGTSYCTRIGSD